jgi:hypothetical protein
MINDDGLMVLMMVVVDGDRWKMVGWWVRKGKQAYEWVVIGLQKPVLRTG